MASFSKSLFSRPESETPTGPAVPLDELLDIPDMDPTWAEGSSFFHTKARCTRFQAIDQKNRRSQKTEPFGKTLCTICKEITQRGRKG